LSDDREATNQRLAELTISLGIRGRIQEWLQNLSMQNLPVSTVRQLRKTMRDSVRSYVQQRGTDVLEGLSKSIDWENISRLLLKRLQTSAVMSASLGIVSQELALVLERYLERDLENIVAQAIPILNIDQVIVDRVKGTSPQELELAIQGIVQSELQGIVNLGGILGVFVGCLQTVVLLIQRCIYFDSCEIFVVV
jgi:Uncharacterized protein conserved in bacteria